MRKFLLAATILAPFAVAPAFADMPANLTAAGDINLAKTAAGSTAGVASQQGTMAASKVGGNGAVLTGAVSGNYTQVNTAAGATAGPKGSYTNTTAQQVNIGGTVTGGVANSAKRGNGATGAAGAASGGQSSQATGGAAATAANTNLGGFIAVQQPRGGHPAR